MLSRLFKSGQGKGSDKAVPKRSGQNMGRKGAKREEREKLAEEAEKVAKEKAEREDQELMRRRGDIMDRTEMGSSKLEMKQDPMGLVDRIEAHQAGTFMKNVVISNKPPPDRELNLARLRTYKPQNDMAKMSLMDIESFDLTDELTEFPITHAISQSQLQQLKRYCLVSDVFVHYVPLDTFFSVSSPVNFFLNDFRKVEDTVVRYYPLTHSGGYNILFSLDYCVRSQDLDQLSLSISTSLSSFRKGVAWASVKVIITLTHMDFPVKANMQETMGVLHLADSDLQDYIADPRGSDGVITPEALKLLKQAYNRGDIENVIKSKDDTRAVNQARTEFAKMDPAIPASNLLRSLRENALEKEREQALVRREPIKSAMKPVSPQAIEEEREREKNFVVPGEEVEPFESLSQNSDEGTIEIPRTGTPPRGNKAVNFGMA